MKRRHLSAVVDVHRAVAVGIADRIGPPARPIDVHSAIRIDRRVTKNVRTTRIQQSDTCCHTVTHWKDELPELRKRVGVQCHDAGSDGMLAKRGTRHIVANCDEYGKGTTWAKRTHSRTSIDRVLKGFIRKHLAGSKAEDPKHAFLGARVQAHVDPLVGPYHYTARGGETGSRDTSCMPYLFAVLQPNTICSPIDAVEQD
mmetsp:Transcript_121168/g.302393  ORF Transcript_121168/g.302393 Transcript_121168/m.302393 type:complete len:200 (-) Transcript_121168:446-1045(-)